MPYLQIVRALYWNWNRRTRWSVYFYTSPLRPGSHLIGIKAISALQTKHRWHHALQSFTFAFLSAKSWRALTRVFLERRGLIAIDELVIFFDPSIPTPALSYGEEATAASTVSVESLLFFFFLFRRSSSSWSAHHSVHVEGHATRCLEDTSVHRISFSLFIFFLISCTRPPFVSCSPLFHLFLHFEERHENSWKTRTLRAFPFRDSNGYLFDTLIHCNTFGTNIHKNLVRNLCVDYKRIIFAIFA